MTLLAKKHADEIREMWQSRALRSSSGRMRKVMITALTKEYPAAIVTLAKVTFPKFVDFDLPLFLSYATVEIDGSITCECHGHRQEKRRAGASTTATEDFIYEGRRLADGLKLNDRDRSEMFAVLAASGSHRIRRVGVLGQRLAS